MKSISTILLFLFICSHTYKSMKVKNTSNLTQEKSSQINSNSFDAVLQAIQTLIDEAGARIKQLEIEFSKNEKICGKLQALIKENTKEFKFGRSSKEIQNDIKSLREQLIILSESLIVEKKKLEIIKCENKICKECEDDNSKVLTVETAIDELNKKIEQTLDSISKFRLEESNSKSVYDEYLKSLQILEESKPEANKICALVDEAKKKIENA